MRKLFRKLVDWMYLKWGTRNIVEMTRNQLWGIFPDDLIHKEDLDAKMSPSQRGDLVFSANQTLNGMAFNCAVNNVKRRIIIHNQEVANNEQIFYNRFSINGVDLIVEEIERLSTLEGGEEEVAESPHDMME